MRQIKVMSQSRAERFSYKINRGDTMLIISITSSSESRAHFAQLPPDSHILRLSFADTTKSANRMKESDAEAIWRAVEAQDYQTVIIHCHAGVSRSAAIGEVLGNTYNVPVEYCEDENTPNEWVKHMMLATRESHNLANMKEFEHDQRIS